jgi:hypothetical protein
MLDVDSPHTKFSPNPFGSFWRITCVQADATSLYCIHLTTCILCQEHVVMKTRIKDILPRTRFEQGASWIRGRSSIQWSTHYVTLEYSCSIWVLRTQQCLWHRMHQAAEQNEILPTIPHYLAWKWPVIAQSEEWLNYGLGDQVSIPGRGRDFLSSTPRPDRSEVHPASYSMGTGDSFTGSKATGAWSWPLTDIYRRG